MKKFLLEITTKNGSFFSIVKENSDFYTMIREIKREGFVTWGSAEHGTRKVIPWEEISEITDRGDPDECNKKKLLRAPGS